MGIKGWLTGPRSKNTAKAQEQGQPILDKHRIAVLPFANMSPDPADEYFADGLTEELISKLSLVKGLRVIARTSVMFYKKKEKRVSEIGRELGVGSVVEGSVRKAGNKIRVTAQLVDTGTEEHLWASTYDKNMDDIFEVQTDLASNIAEKLPEGLTFPVPHNRRGETDNITAYSYYLKSKQLLNEGTDSSVKEALDLLTKATKLSPSFARAYTEIGRCYAELGVRSQISYDQSISGMRLAAKKALEIDGNLPEGHALLAYVLWAEDDVVNDEKEAMRAIELNPNLAEAYDTLALIRAGKGYLKEATVHLEKAHLIDPLSSDILRDLGLLYFYSGRENDALELWNANREFSPLAITKSLARYHIEKRELGRAEELVRTLEGIAPSDSQTVLFRGILSALKKDLKGTNNAIERLHKEFGGGATLDRNIGYIRYGQGDLDAYFSAMMRAVQNHVLDPISLRYSPLFANARADKRYRQVLLKNKLDPDVKES